MLFLKRFKKKYENHGRVISNLTPITVNLIDLKFEIELKMK